MRLTQVADSNNIVVCRDGEFQNLGFLRDHQEGMLVFLENAGAAAALQRNPDIRAVLTAPDLAEQIPDHLALAVCQQPKLAFAQIHNRLANKGFYWEDFATVIDPSAEVHPAAWIAGKNVRIGPKAVVGPRATILERCVIERDVSVGAGAVLGGVGFQTVRSHQPMLEMRHAGGLTIRPHAHILPGAIIATGLFRHHTELGEDVRVGCRAFISHAVQVGERSFVGHGAVVNGNVVIGREVWIGPGAVVSNNLKIDEQAFVSLGAVVMRDISAGQRVTGNFAIAHTMHLRMLAAAESDG